MNPILSNLPNPQMAQLKQIFSMMQGAKNPQAMLAQLTNSNPQMKQVMDLVNSNGGNAKELFYKLAQQKGVDPETILNQLR